MNDAQAAARGRATILLGNGFSIDYDSDVFNYASLAEKAELRNLSVDKADLFESLKSHNFETIIEKLGASASLHKLYAPRSRLASVMKRDAKIVRRGLADSLANLHPDSSMELTDAEVHHAATFLGNFRAIYTVNYDLLLYWVINRTSSVRVVKRDGFEWPSWHPSKQYVWKANPTQGQQKIFYLHGALHLFSTDKRMTKIANAAHGRLIDELRRRLARGKYPVVITEGTRSEKEARIDKSPYLRTAFRRFGGVSGALFIHGMSLSENDDHLLELVGLKESKVNALYVGVHGAPSTRASERLIRRARLIKDARAENGGPSLRLKFYDAASARVWR